MAQDPESPQFTHDCTTLSGSSGSCLLDFGRHSVLGLHYGGNYLVENRAVSLPALKNDPHLAGKGLRFC
jgi:endonuclease G